MIVAVTTLDPLKQEKAKALAAERMKRRGEPHLVVLSDYRRLMDAIMYRPDIFVHWGDDEPNEVGLSVSDVVKYIGGEVIQIGG